MLVKLVVVLSLFTSAVCLAGAKKKAKPRIDDRQGALIQPQEIQSQEVQLQDAQRQKIDWEARQVIPVPLVEMADKKGNLVYLSHSKSGDRLDQENLRLVFLSDIHIHQKALGYHSQTAAPTEQMINLIPQGDILIIAGDLTGAGSRQEVEEFRSFIDQLHTSGRFENIVFIPGNHDRILHREYYLKKGHRFHKGITDPVSELESAQQALDHLPKNVYYLLDSAITLEGYRIYGTPWVEGIINWGFSIDEEGLKEKWAEIPNDIDILISHMPPYCHGDYEGYAMGGLGKQKTFSHTGSKSLLEKSLQIQPLVHVFGHVHEGYGASIRDGFKTLFINAATCDEDYHPIQKPIVLDLPRRQ